jgi:sugar (pentulose or hexulose) kinase
MLTQRPPSELDSALDKVSKRKPHTERMHRPRFPKVSVGRTLSFLLLAGFPEDCVVCAGTTDSIAAFLAAEPSQPGEAVSREDPKLIFLLLTRLRESQTLMASRDEARVSRFVFLLNSSLA